jgi:hypothetical protein
MSAIAGRSAAACESRKAHAAQPEDFRGRKRYCPDQRHHRKNRCRAGIAGFVQARSQAGAQLSKARASAANALQRAQDERQARLTMR